MAGRLSAAQKEEMASRAVAMSVRGATYTEIAEKLEITRNTAASWIKGEYATRAEHRDNLKEEAKAHYRQIIRAAWESYQAVDEKSLNKSGHLNAAIRAQERIDKIDGNEAPSKYSDESPPRRFTLELGDRTLEAVDAPDQT